MPTSATLNGYVNQATGKLDPDAPAPGKTIIINGTGFGSGPNVLLFDQFIGVDGAPAFRRPDVGSWSNVSTFEAGTPIPRLIYDSHSDRTYLSGRDRNNLSSNDRLQSSLFKYTGILTKFRYMHRKWVPPEFKYPGATTPGVMPASSSLKETWFGKSNASRTDLLGTNEPHRNSCIPTHTGNGIMSVGGNNNAPRSWDDIEEKEKDFYYPPNSFTAPTLYSFYQDGAGTAGVFNRTVSIMGVNDNSFSVITRNNCDPFNSKDIPDSSFNTRDYDGFRFPGWMIDNNLSAGVNALFNDCWLAEGDNCWACVFVSDNPDFNVATRHLYPCYAPLWSDTEIRTRLYDHNDFGENTHIHVQLANGDVLENVPFTRV